MDAILHNVTAPYSLSAPRAEKMVPDKYPRFQTPVNVSKERNLGMNDQGLYYKTLNDPTLPEKRRYDYNQ